MSTLTPAQTLTTKLRPLRGSKGHRSLHPGTNVLFRDSRDERVRRTGDTASEQELVNITTVLRRPLTLRVRPVSTYPVLSALAVSGLPA